MKETVKTFVIVVLVLLVVLLSVTSMKYYQKSQEKPEKVYLTDTITNVVYDTVFFDHFEIVKLPVDTITIINDSIRIDSVSVEVPISIYKLDTTFSTDTTSLNIHIQNSGYAVTLDTIFYKFEYTPTSIKLPKTNFFRDHFRFGVGVSSGYGFFSKQPDVFLGVGVYYVF